jgi:Flp pilus assembly protein TadG
MMRLRRIGGFKASHAGNSAIEFAMIAPVLLAMSAGVYELGRAFQSLSAANKLASQYAIAWADCADLPAGTCNTELGIYDTSSAMKNIAPQLTNTITLQMFQVTMSGSTPTVTYSYPNGGALSSAQTSAAATTLSSGQKGVIVTVKYTHTLDIFSGVLSGIVPSSIPMSYTVVQLKA